MDYERINHKAQMGVISPTRLRMKLLGVHNSRKKEGGNNSSRTSPSKPEGLENSKNHLLTSDLDEQVSSIDLKHVANSLDPKLNLPPKDKTETGHSKTQNITRPISYPLQFTNNLSSVHPMRSVEEDASGNGYDSGHDNGSTSSFEFHRDNRSSHFFRHVPSKWNDAEKWIVNKQSTHPNGLKKNVPQISRQMSLNMLSDTKRIDLSNSASQNLVGKFSFVPHYLQPKLVSENETSSSINCSQGTGDDQKTSVSETHIPKVTANQNVESVSMRDVGTEMTPIPSQDPSRTATPIGATTPSVTPKTSTPTTPKKRAAQASIDPSIINEKDCEGKKGELELSERELKLKTRREIATLGMKLGKMNIASWATKEFEDVASSPRNFDAEKNLKEEYESRAMAWEEAEKAKHMARYKREEIKIQAWESHQKAKIEARTRKLEVEAEQMRSKGHEKIAQKLLKARQQVEERRSDAEARKNQMAARTVHQVEQIRQTGRLPNSHIRCCSWLM